MFWRKKRTYFNYLVMSRELLKTDSVTDTQQLNYDVECLILDIEDEGGTILAVKTSPIEISQYGVCRATIEISYTTEGR